MKLLRNGKHHSKTLQADYDKYGEMSFVMSIVEKCSDDKKLEREQHYIDLYNAAHEGYNVSDSAYFSNSGFCTMNKNGEKNPFYGKHHTEATRKKLRDKWAENREKRSGFSRTEETKQKIRETKIGKKNPNATPVLQFDPTGKFIKEWDYIQDASDYYGMKSKSSISNCCKGNVGKQSNYHIAKGYIWKYADKPKTKGK